MKNTTLQNLLINNLIANTYMKPRIIGDMECSLTIALLTEYKESYDCELVIMVHYSKVLDEIRLLNVYAINGFITSKNIKDIENAINDSNRRYNEITRDLEKSGEVKIDKKLKVEKVEIKDENDKVIDEKYVIQSDEYTDKENIKRTQELRGGLKKLKYGVKFIPTDGMYKETGMPETTSEYSLFVVNLENKPDFLTDIAKLSEYYNQDSFLFKAKEDEEAFYVGTNNGWLGYHEVEMIKNNGESAKLKVNSFTNKYYTKVNSKSGGTGNSFTFETLKEQFMNENLNYTTSVNNNDLEIEEPHRYSMSEYYHERMLYGRVLNSVRTKREWETLITKLKI